MKNTLKIGLTLGLMTVLGTGGLAAVARAKGNASAPTDRIAQRADAEAGDEADEGPETEDDAQESAQYQSQAKITPQQAQQAAATAVGGTAARAELENEDGNLVYQVMVGQTEVLVDAGNGNILHREEVNVEENDATEAPLPRSSVQVPNDDSESGETPGR
jgi:uncharacterized membrane protein YkoI